MPRLAAVGAGRTVASVNLYLVPRTRVLRSEEELAAALDCMPAVNETLREHVRWVRSYFVAEDDGTISGYCLYEATSREMLARHAEALMLPLDGIKLVKSTVVAAPDPEPVHVA